METYYQENSSKQTLLPSLYEVIMLYASAFTTLAVLNIADVVKSISHQNFETLSLQISNFLTNKLQKLDGLVPKGVFSFLFWALTGALVYLVMWIIFAALRSYRDDTALITSYVFPSQTKRKDVLHAIIFRITVRVVSFAALIFWLILLFSGVLPVTATMIIKAVYTSKLLTAVYIIEALTIVATSFYVCMTLLRFGLLRRRILNR